MKWFVNPCLLRASVMKFHSILSKAFARSKFEQKSLLFPGFKVKRVDNFFGYDDARSNVPSLNKSSLTRVDDTWKVIFDSISKRFGNYFIAYIAKAYRAKIFRCNWRIDFRNKGYVSDVNFWTQCTILGCSAPQRKEGERRERAYLVGDRRR